MDKNLQESYIAKMTDCLPVLRKQANLTQGELAEIIGVSKFTVLAIEKKQRAMSWGAFLSLLFVFSKNEQTDKLLKVYGIDTNDINRLINQSEPTADLKEKN